MAINNGAAVNLSTVNSLFKLRIKFRYTTRRGGQNGAEKNRKWTDSAENGGGGGASVNKEGAI
jgi:hypothetical protein